MIGEGVLQVQVPGTDQWARARFYVGEGSTAVAFRLVSEQIEWEGKMETVYELELALK
jgi:hypothetical protein